MKNIKKIFFTFLTLSTFFYCNLPQNTMQQKIKHDKQCVYLLGTYRHYWCKDSIGDSGFRLLATENLKNMQCSFIGEKWHKIAPYLGKPNKVYVTDSTINIIYYLNNIKDTDFGRKYMGIDISKKDSLIIWLGYWMKDG